MGSLKEFGDMLRDTKSIIKEIKCKADDIKGYSIAKQSSASTLQFPIIMSRSINVDTASSIVKALERQYAIFVQLTIQLNPVIDWEEDDIAGFINRIHQNSPTPIDVIESCINVYSDEALGLRMIMSLNEGCNGQVLRSNKEQLMVIEDHLNKNKLNDLYKPEQITLEHANASLDYFMLTEAKNRPKKDNGKKSFKGFDEFGKAYNDINNGENPEPSNSGTNVNMGEGAGGVNEPKGDKQNKKEEPKATNTKKDTKEQPKQKESKDDKKVNGHNNNSN